ncbi:phospholipase D-like domain-containing protein [Microlunatus sp. GCM10028923]|uniref:phospholipase D-like domain-containing protein n=1 Tax=Microlunatus sp. GCM10028923 TaxID=3273400 RepID=UPI00361C2154
MSRTSAGRSPLLAAVLTAALVLFGTVVTTGPAAAEPRAADCAQTGAIFNHPHSDPRRIHEHLECLIDGTPEGAEIRMASYRFADGEVVAALDRAIERGVKLKIIVDHRFVADDEHPDFALFWGLQKKIGSDKTKDSWAAPCPGEGDDGACIGSFKMHNKQFTFSETHGVPDVTFITSSNLEDKEIPVADNDGIFMWNSGYTAANDAPLYDWFANRYFTDLAAEHPANDDYFEERKLPAEDGLGNYKVYHSPRKSGNTVLDILDKINCHGSTTGGTDPGNRTIVRVAVWAISGNELSDPGVKIAKRLWDLDNEGCYVDIVADRIDADTDGPLRTLLRKPERTEIGKQQNYHGPEVREFNNKQDFGTHQKNLLIEGTYDGQKNQKIVFTGSVNFTYRSVRVNDETWLQINDGGVYDRFAENFADVRQAAHSCWQSSRDTSCTGERDHPKPTKPYTCHETADEYGDSGNLYLYRGETCAGDNDAKDADNDQDYGDDKGDIKDFDNRTVSIVNTTKRHVKFYNYPRYNEGHPEGDSFCVRPGQWVNRLAPYGDDDSSWSGSISSHELVDAGDCDRWFGGYHEPNR